MMNKYQLICPKCKKVYNIGLDSCIITMYDVAQTPGITIDFSGLAKRPIAPIQDPALVCYPSGDEENKRDLVNNSIKTVEAINSIIESGQKQYWYCKCCDDNEVFEFQNSLSEQITNNITASSFPDLPDAWSEDCNSTLLLIVSAEIGVAFNITDFLAGNGKYGKCIKDTHSINGKYFSSKDEGDRIHKLVWDYLFSLIHESKEEEIGKKLLLFFIATAQQLPKSISSTKLQSLYCDMYTLCALYGEHSISRKVWEYCDQKWPVENCGTWFEEVRLHNIPEILKILDYGFDIDTVDDDGFTALMKAIQCGQTRLVKTLRERGATIKPINITLSYDALSLAAIKGSNKILNILFETTSSSDNVFDFIGKALLAASKNGKTESVEILLEKGADINIVDEEFNTPLFLAIENDQIDVVKILLACGARFDLKNKNGLTAFNYAKINKSKLILELLKTYSKDKKWWQLWK